MICLCSKIWKYNTFNRVITQYKTTDQDDHHCRMTSSDLQKEWQTAARVRCKARMVQNKLLGAGQSQKKKPFINEKQRRARLRLARIELQRTGVRASSPMSPIYSFAQHLVIQWLDGDLERRTSHSVSHPLWNLVEDRWWSRGASARLESDTLVSVKEHESSYIQSCPERKLAFFFSDTVPQIKMEDLSSTISRSDLHWKPLECDQEEDGWSQAIKQSRASWIDLLQMA